MFIPRYIGNERIVYLNIRRVSCLFKLLMVLVLVVLIVIRAQLKRCVLLTSWAYFVIHLQNRVTNRPWISLEKSVCPVLGNNHEKHKMSPRKSNWVIEFIPSSAQSKRSQLLELQRWVGLGAWWFGSIWHSSQLPSIPEEDNKIEMRWYRDSWSGKGRGGELFLRDRQLLPCPHFLVVACNLSCNKLELNSICGCSTRSLVVVLLCCPGPKVVSTSNGSMPSRIL